jgi:TctA family transporter
VRPAPLLLGFVLGPMTEENLGRALLLFRGDPAVFLARPIWLALLPGAGALLLLYRAVEFPQERRGSVRGS